MSSFSQKFIFLNVTNSLVNEKNELAFPSMFYGYIR